LTAPVSASTAVPRPMYVDRPATLSSSSLLYQVGYGGGRNRRYMNGSGYHDWLATDGFYTNVFAYTSKYNGPGGGERGLNIEGGDSGGPTFLDNASGYLLGDLSFWDPLAIATFGPGGMGRPAVREWLSEKVPQKPDFEVVSITTSCQGMAGPSPVIVRVRN